MKKLFIFVISIFITFTLIAQDKYNTYDIATEIGGIYLTSDETDNKSFKSNNFTKTYHLNPDIEYCFGLYGINTTFEINGITIIPNGDITSLNMTVEEKTLLIVTIKGVYKKSYGLIVLCMNNP